MILKCTSWVTKQLQADIIELAYAEKASSIALVPKKGGNIWVCRNYRYLKASIIPNTYPILREEDCTDCLGEVKLFTAMDALLEFSQAPIEDEDENKNTLKFLLWHLPLLSNADWLTEDACYISMGTGYYLI